MSDLAQLSDIQTLWRSLTSAEQTRASALLPIVSDTLRYEADKVGKDLDAMILAQTGLANVVKQVVVDIIARTLMTSTNQEPMTQASQSVGGYSFSGTYLSPGGGLFIKKQELARIGIKRQRVGYCDYEFD